MNTEKNFSVFMLLFLLLSFNSQVLSVSSLNKKFFSETKVPLNPTYLNNVNQVDISVKILNAPEKIFVNEVFEAVVEVSNWGLNIASGFVLNFYITSYTEPYGIREERRVLTLYPNETQLVYFDWVPEEEGHYELTVSVSLPPHVKEINPIDNFDDFSFWVETPPPSPPPPPTKPVEKHLSEVSEIREFGFVFGEKGTIYDSETIKVLMDNFKLETGCLDRNFAPHPGKDYFVIGGPLRNRCTSSFNQHLNILFEKIGNAIVLQVGSVIFHYSLILFGKEDYSVLAVDDTGNFTSWLLEGCTRYGTAAAALYLINYKYSLQGLKTVVIHWLDSDGSGNVTSNDTFQLIFYS